MDRVVACMEETILGTQGCGIPPRTQLRPGAGQPDSGDAPPVAEPQEHVIRADRPSVPGARLGRTPKGNLLGSFRIRNGPENISW